MLEFRMQWALGIVATVCFVAAILHIEISSRRAWALFWVGAALAAIIPLI